MVVDMYQLMYMRVGSLLFVFYFPSFCNLPCPGPWPALCLTMRVTYLFPGKVLRACCQASFPQFRSGNLDVLGPFWESGRPGATNASVGLRRGGKTYIGQKFVIAGIVR